MSTIEIVLCVIIGIIVFSLCFAVIVHSSYSKTPRRKRNCEIENRSDLPPIWKSVVGRIVEGKTWILSRNPEQLTIRSFDGLKLFGTYIAAEHETKNTVLAVHGYMNTGLNEFAMYAKFYHDMGYNVLIVDCRGHGKSGGNYITFGYYDKFDCQYWCKYLHSRFGDGCKIMIHGISMGAATSIMTAGEHPDCLCGVVADCGYTCVLDVFSHVMDRRFGVNPRVILYLTSLVNRVLCGFWYKDCSALMQIKKATVPFLIIHGSHDNFVPVHMAYELFEVCPTEKELVIVDNAPHSASFFTENSSAPERIIAFADRIGMNDVDK